MSYIAGPYTYTYDSVYLGNNASLGTTQDGMTINVTSFKELIVGDNMGRTVQDAVFTGQDCTSDLTLNEWDRAAAQALFMPYGTAFLSFAVVGRVDVQQLLAKSLVCTAIAGTPAANSPATITLSRTILHEDYPINHILRAAHRRVPLRLRHYPTLNTETMVARFGVTT
jgi:hypothetical protein